MKLALEEKTILVVDDEPSVRHFIGRVLHNICPLCEVKEAVDLQEARGKVMESSPDLVILDLRMPGGNGTKLCRLMQGHPRFYKTRILVITGDHSRQVRDDIFSQGACEFLPKPFDISELAGSVARLLA